MLFVLVTLKKPLLQLIFSALLCMGICHVKDLILYAEIGYKINAEGIQVMVCFSVSCLKATKSLALYSRRKRLGPMI